MKCDGCEKEYRAHKGLTLKDMNQSKIIIHVCGFWCMIIAIIKHLKKKEKGNNDNS